MGAWLEDAQGKRLRVPARGLLLGRGPQCDVLLDNPGASRTHAWVRPSGPELDLVVLGRNPTVVNDKPAHGKVTLADGDVVKLPGTRFVVRLQTESRGRIPSTWSVQIGDLWLQIGTEITIGNAMDDVQLPEMPHRAVSLRKVGDALFLEAGMPLQLDDDTVEPGEVALVSPGSRVRVGGQVLKVQAVGGTVSGTHEDPLRSPPAPTRARFSFLPVGGQLSLELQGTAYVVELSEMRARLVATLLGPPSGYNAGEFVPDEVLLPAIWPNDPGKDRLHLNSLVHRTRKSLVQAGVDPRWVLERLQAGGATRFRLSDGAHAVIE